MMLLLMLADVTEARTNHQQEAAEYYFNHYQINKPRVITSKCLRITTNLKDH